MRIGMFSDSYKPYTSGVVTSIVSFKEELTKLGHEIFVFAPSYPQETEEENVFRFFSFPAPTKKDFSLAFPVYPGMNLLLKRLNLDIIHVHSPFTMGRVGHHYARKFRLPLVFTFHTRYDQYVHYVPLPQSIVRDITIKYARSFCNHCDQVIVPTKEIEKIVESFDVNTPISVIPTGVQLNKFITGDKNWLRKRYDIPADNKILLFVGRLCREKNLFFLLESFKIVKEKNPQVSLVLTASGPIEEELKSFTTELGLDLHKDVIFTGAVPFEHLKNVYHSADLFVFASLTETQGLVLLEAMASGLPVVAVRASGVQDMVDHGVDGLLCSEDQNELADNIIKILQDRVLYNYLKTNTARKAKLLSSENMAIKLQGVYEELIAQNTHHKIHPKLLYNNLNTKFYHAPD